MHLGIDLGGTKIEIIALNSTRQELYRKRIPSPQHSYQQTLDTLIQLVTETEQILGARCSLGLGIPGAIAPATQCVINANSTWLIGQPLQRDLSAQLGREIVIANDADCFTLSEAFDGAGARYKTVFGVILGTGVGGGIAINKQLIKGPNAIAGEWGHNPLPSGKDRHDLQTSCYCGKSNCIETYLSGPGMLSLFQQQAQISLAQSGVEDFMRLVRDPSLQHHTIAAHYWRQYLDRLARSLAGVINILDPEAIVFGGGLSNIDELYQELPQALLPYVFSSTLNTLFSKAKYGDSSGVRGAAWLGAKDYPS